MFLDVLGGLVVLDRDSHRVGNSSAAQVAAGSSDARLPTLLTKFACVINCSRDANRRSMCRRTVTCSFSAGQYHLLALASCRTVSGRLSSGLGQTKPLLWI